MSQALKLLSPDAGYALGEEAFKAGCQAIIDELPNSEMFGPSALLIENAWSKYEPSEAVKELIHG